MTLDELNTEIRKLCEAIVSFGMEAIGSRKLQPINGERPGVGD